MRFRIGLAALLAVAAGAAAAPAHGEFYCCYIPSYTERVSVSSSEAQADHESGYTPRMSANGRWVAFASHADNLVPGDNDTQWDVFVRDRTAGTTVIVSLKPNGDPIVGQAKEPAMSGDGRFVAFTTNSTLVPEDTNGCWDVYLRDRDTDQDGTFDEPGATSVVLASKNDAGFGGNEMTTTPDISDDGRFVVFTSKSTNLDNGDSNGTHDVFIRDMLQGETRRVSKGAGLGEPNSWSGGASITPDGKYVAFHSGATNMVPNDGNGHFDAFRWDRDTHDIVRISVGPGGVEGNGDSHGAAMSADGSRIAFVSDATNFLANDANGTARDVFLRDLTSQTTTLVSRATGGAQSNMTTQTNLPSISANGSRVAFTSYGTNLVQGDGNGKVDAFVRNVDTAQTRRVSVSTGGTEGNGDTSFASISPNGSYVAIVSEASNLVQGDGNGVRDVFVRYG